MFASIEPTDAEVVARMPGDDVLVPADVVMDRAFTVPGTPEQVWPWMVQLGKGRGRWYLPRSLERLLPPSGRGLRHIDPRWQRLEPGDVVPDYGRDETFTVQQIDPPHELVYHSRRGRRMAVTWAITLTPTAPPTAPTTAPTRGTAGSATAAEATRVRLRLRFHGVKRTWLVRSGGELIDLLTIAGMAAGLRERLTDPLPERRTRA